MKQNFFRMILAAVVFTGSMTATALAQEPVALKRLPALAPDIAAFPRLVEQPGGNAAARINRALAAGDARAAHAARECRALGKDRSDWSRSIVATMRGPHYLSLLASDGWFCGGAHPDDDTIALVYDLATGAPVNWKRLLPAALAEKMRTDTAGDGTVLGLISSPALAELYMKAAEKAQQIDKDCAEALADPGTTGGEGLSFILWPDAEAGGIDVQPAGLAHVIAACGPSVTLAMPELRKLGVDARLLDSISEAHRQGWYDKAAK